MSFSIALMALSHVILQNLNLNLLLPQTIKWLWYYTHQYRNISFHQGPIKFTTCESFYNHTDNTSGILMFNLLLMLEFTLPHDQL